VLASASPRRRELLASAGVPLLVRPTDTPEEERPGEPPRQYCLRVAREKATAADASDPLDGPDLLVLAADTTVALDDWIPGKPGTPKRAEATLRRLSGRWHAVHTAVVLRSGARLRHRIVTTRVRFRELTDAEIRRYVDTGEPLDRAGGYAIQGGGGAFVDRIVGSYTGVVGLPLKESLALIRTAGGG
jgi:septum formation protein